MLTWKTPLIMLTWKIPLIRNYGAFCMYKDEAYYIFFLLYFSVHVPGMVHNLLVTPLSPTAISVTWDPPTEHADNIIKYRIHYYKTGNHVSIIVLMLTFLVYPPNVHDKLLMTRPWVSRTHTTSTQRTLLTRYGIS